MKKNSHELLKGRKLIRAIYVSSYIPRKCGIATYTKDLTNAINLLNPYALAEIMVMHRENEDYDFPWEVKYKIEESRQESYLEAAHYLNNSSADVVVVELEFGIFGGDGGRFVADLIDHLEKKVVVTCHTIIDDPMNEYGLVLQRVANKADALVVMMETSAKKLHKLYNVPYKKIAVIPHGTPDLTFTSSDYYKKRKRIGINRLVLGNINLISPNKGIGYAIEAMATIVKKIPDALYVVVGQTHPVLKSKEGEVYRTQLRKMVRDLGLQKNVKFVNEYLSLRDLLQWLRAMDIYVTPYIDPEQSSSGALAYAIGAGKICISTPYLYAKQVLAHERGIFVPFKNGKAIGEAVIKIWENKEEQMSIRNNAYGYGRLMTWSNVALRYLDLFNTILCR